MYAIPRLLGCVRHCADVGEPGPCALDPGRLGARRLQPSRLGSLGDGYATVGGLETGARRKGLSGPAQTWRSWLSGWGNLRVEAEDFREVDAEGVFILSTTIGRDKTSGVGPGQSRVRGAVVFHVRHGKVPRLAQDRDRALTDLGRAQ
jgi:hypothetical protein